MNPSAHTFGPQIGIPLSGGNAASIPAALSDMEAFHARMNQFDAEYRADEASADMRYDRPSVANTWLSDVSGQLDSAFETGLPPGFSDAPVIAQIEMVGSMQRQILKAQTMFSATNAAMKGTQKSTETILNQKG